jgi:NDP-sugar pyrophosphorylase family protein
LIQSTRLPPRALVLTAGLGTRLRPLTLVRAKAAVPVNGEPLATRVVRWLASRGIRDIVLNLHHKPETIAAAVGDGSDLGVRVRYSWEQPVLGSAGGPRHALPLLTDGGREQFVIVNGDTLTNVDLDALYKAHQSSDALVTMALIPNPRPEKYGGVRLDAESSVTAFTRRASEARTFHFIGVQVADARVFADLPDGVPHESVGALYPRLMAESPGCIRGYVSDASFQDIGTPADCLETSLALAATEGDHMISARAAVADSARIERSALWDDVVVGRGAHLTDCIVADGAHVPAGMTLQRCAIVPASAGDPQDGDRVERGLLIRPFAN